MLRFAIIALLFITLPTYSQLPTLAWAKSMGGTSTETGRAVVVDGQGNVISLGEFTGTIDLDPGPGVTSFTAPNSYDVYIQKLDPNGNFIWAVAFGNSVFHDLGYALTLDAVGNIYVAGSFSDVVDFDPGPGTFTLTAVGNYDAYLLKLDPSGGFAWAGDMGGNFGDEAYGIVIDGSGYIYITGGFQSTADFDPGPGIFTMTSGGTYDIFVVRLDFNGNFSWAKRAGGSGVNIGSCVSVNAAGNAVYIGGQFMGTGDFDPSPGFYNLTSSGAIDAFEWKLDSAGNLLWANGFGGIYDDMLKSITIDANNDVITAGYFRDTVDFDPGPGTFNIGSAGTDDVFIHKINSSGNLVWVKTIGYTNYDKAFSVATDLAGNIYCTGYFKGTVDFDPGPGTYTLFASSENVFLLRLGANGSFVWAFDLGNVNADFSFSVYASPADDLFITGFYNLTVDFDPSPGVFNMTPVGGQDIFVAKYYDGLWGDSEEEMLTDTHVFPNPFTNELLVTIPIAIGTEFLVEITLYDVLGNVIGVWKPGTRNLKLETSNLLKGVYFLHLKTKEGTVTKKLVKQ